MIFTRQQRTSDIRESADERISADFHPAASPTSLQIGLWVLLLVSAAIMCALSFHSFQIGVWNDDTAYALLARSLVGSDHYGSLANLDPPAGIPWFPFGFPLLLAPAVVLAPGNLDALRVPSLLATFLSATLLFWGWRWLSRTTSYWWALAVTALFLTSVTTVNWAAMVLSEPAFTTFYLLAVILAERVVRKEAGGWWPLPMGIILVFIVFTRTIGAVVALTIVAYLLVRGGRAAWRGLALSAASAVVVLVLVIALTPIALGDVLPIRYITEYGSLAGKGAVTTSANASTQAGSPSASPPSGWQTKQVSLLLDAGRRHITDDFRSAIVPMRGGKLESALGGQSTGGMVPIALGLATFGVLALGFVWWLYRERAPLFAVSAIVYLGSIFLWLWTGPRFLYPVQPQLFGAVLFGIEAIVLGLARLTQRRIGSMRLANGALAAATIVLLLGFAYRNATPDPSVGHVGDLEARASWLEANTPSSATIMAEDAPLAVLYSGRRVTAYPDACLSPSSLEEYLATRRVDYVLVAPTTQWQATYSPRYSTLATCVQSQLQSLVAAHRVELSYSSPHDEVQVYKTRLGL